MNHNLIATTVALTCGISILIGAVYMSEADAKMNPLTRTDKTKSAKRVPVLVELFTSEGCSSCPSADAALAKLQRDQPYSDALIIPLSEHVDYWNNIGWKDPFSTSGFSNRQGDYSKALHLDNVYTPQMVVDGQQEFVGSDTEATTKAVETSIKRQKADIILETIPDRNDSVAITIKNLPPVKHGDTAEVVLAITEDNLSSSVQRGENAGRKLAHVAVVRSLQSIGTITSGQTLHMTQMLTVRPSWKRRDLSVVVFVQEHSSRRILGAGLIALMSAKN